MAIQSILFDFNGVIVNDEPLHMQAYREVFGARGIEISDDEYFSLLGADDMTFVRTIFERAGRQAGPAEIEEARAEKSEKYHGLIAGEIPLFDGAENFIKSCAHYFALGIVSMAPRAEIEDILRRARLRDCFSLIVSAEDVPRPKPDPLCYKLGFVRLDDIRCTQQGRFPMSNGECLAIEDSPPGIRAARGAMLPTLAVTNTVPEKNLRDAGADVVTCSLVDWTPEAVSGAFR
jgi:beta-phosphoglucomutase-like phosphatase (HAD superfamily)